MKNDQKIPVKNRFSRRIEELLSATHPLSRELLLELEPAEIQKLGQIALGEIPDMSRGERVKALVAISRLGGVEECKILSRVIADERAEIDLRAVAASSLILFPPGDAEPELIANLGIKEDLIRLKVVKSLGCIGGVKALEALDRVSDVKSDFVRKQLAFAKALISYRLGLDREDLPFVEGAKRKAGPKDELIELTMSMKGREEVQNCLRLLEGSSYGIDVAENLGFEVIAGGKAKWMLLLNKKYAEADIVSSIIKQKMLTGLLTRWAEETDKYGVQYVVLTRPYERKLIGKGLLSLDKKMKRVFEKSKISGLYKPREAHSFDIMVVRTDGEVFYSGHGSVENGIMTFSVSDVEHPGTAPTQVSGLLKPEGVEFKVCIPFRRRKDKRTAQLERPELNVS